MDVNVLEETLSDISSLLGFEIQSKPEQRWSEEFIAILLTLRDTYGKSLIFQLYIIAKSKLATCQHKQGSNISYSCLWKYIQDQIVKATSPGIAAMMKNNISKHAQLLFAIAEYVRQPWFRSLLKDKSSLLSKIA
jgi:hypothetical protein